MKNKKLLQNCDLFYKLATSSKKKNPYAYDYEKGQGRGKPGDLTYRGPRDLGLEQAGREGGFEVRYVGHGPDSPFHLRRLKNKELAVENLDPNWQYPFEFTELSEAIKEANKLYENTHQKYLVVDSFGVWRHLTQSEEEKRRAAQERAEEDKIQLEYDLEYGEFSDEALTEKNKKNILN